MGPSLTDKTGISKHLALKIQATHSITQEGISGGHGLISPPSRKTHSVNTPSIKRELRIKTCNGAQQQQENQQ